MKILALSDIESEFLWDYYKPGRLDEYDVIVACGDLNPLYLSFLATFFRGPVLYVHGNHDGRYEKVPPEGCICIENKIYTYRGVRFMGLGGSIRYKPGPHQYTQGQMKRRAFWMLPRILFTGGFDVLVTHAPAWQLGDHDNHVHTGFQAFRTLMEWWKPRYLIHGHVHLNYGMGKRKLSYCETTIINAYEKYVIDYAEEERNAGSG